MYRDNALVGSPFVRVMAELLAAASLKIIHQVFKRIFERYNDVVSWGERERYLARANFVYADKALKNQNRPLTSEDALEINANHTLRREERNDLIF